MALPSPSNAAGSAQKASEPTSDADAWLVERLVDLDPPGRAQFAARLRSEGSPLATRADQYVRAFDGTLRLGLSRLLSRPAAVAVATLDAPAPPSLSAGETVGSYRVVREIGRGGMGVVYLAERDDLGLRAALKVLDEPAPAPGNGARASDAVSDDARRFHAERRHLARLSHPGVPRIYDAGRTTGGVPFYAMELVEGDPLDDYAEQRGLGAVERVNLFVQLCEIVGHVHRRGLAHGDLKPANVLVQDGEASAEARRSQPVVRLVDFGVAEEVGVPPGPDVRPFTPAFAAPEIFDGAAPSVSTDVFALGAILGDLVASSPKRTDPLSRNRTLPRGADTLPLFDVVIRATRPSADERYGSVDDLLADVREAAVAVALATLPVVRGDGSPPPPRTAKRPTSRQLSRPTARPLWTIVAAAAAGFTVGWWSAR